MRFHTFQLNEPIPELNAPHAVAILKPWMDVGNAGTLALSSLKSYLNAAELGKIAKPGNFFDFTRYRPMLYLKEGRREVSIPNTTIAYAKSEEGHDFLFLHLLEPHMLAEMYIDSIMQLFKRFDVRRYLLVGSMYDMVPYTRPLLVTGSADSVSLQNELDAANVIPSNYEGPTTIAYLVTQEAQAMGIETLSLIVHLPQYLIMENDYQGKKRLMEVFCSLYNLPLAEEDAEKAREQHDHVSKIAEQYIKQEPSYEVILKQLEAYYDSRLRQSKEETKLSPEVEKFLQDMGRRFGQN